MMNIQCYPLRNERVRMSLLNIGAAIHNIEVNIGGQWQSIVVHPQRLLDYSHCPEYYGSTIGPVANRIENAEFWIKQRHYQLDCNEGANHLHGGASALSYQIFTCIEHTDTLCIFTLNSTSAYYPGSLDLQVTYRLQDQRWSITYDYQTSEDCPINITNHCYFNLDKDIPVTQQQLYLRNLYLWQHNDEYLPVSCQYYPYWQGNIPDTLFNRYVETPFPMIYKAQTTGLSLSVTSSYPGAMLYNCYYSGTTLLGNEQPLAPFAAFCIEPQYIPNDIRHQQRSLCIAKQRYHQQLDYQILMTV